MDDNCLYCDLSVAADAGDPQAVRRQIELGANPADEIECNNALALAIGRGHIDIVRMLLDNGADPNRSDPMMLATPITLAVDQRSRGMVELLVHHGANVEDIDIFGVIRSGTESFVEEMIDLGVCVRAIDSQTGRTLLHDAAMYGYDRAAAALARAGVDPLHIDKWGNTAADLAVRNEHRIVVQFLTSFTYEEPDVKAT